MMGIKTDVHLLLHSKNEASFDLPLNLINISVSTSIFL